MNNGNEKMARKHGARARFARCGCRTTTTLTFAEASRSYIWQTQRDGTLARR